MILVRNVFQLKFGQSRDAVAAWKEGLAIAERAGVPRGRWRLLTDLAGPDFYTLVLEGTTNLSVSVIVGQIRSTATDLMTGTGLSYDEATVAVREAIREPD